jgi:hypothetical protein
LYFEVESQHITEGKTILEDVVGKGDKRPYQAKDKEGKWLILGIESL